MLEALNDVARGFLGGGRVRGKWNDTVRARTDQYGGEERFRDSDFVVLDTLIGLAKKRGTSPARLALAWLLHQPGISAPIIGVRRTEQLDEASPHWIFGSKTTRSAR